MPALALHALSLADRPWFEKLVEAHGGVADPLSAYSFPYHYIWRDLFSYEWAELAGHCCLFATNQDGVFLALPPLGPDPCGPAMAQAFEVLAERNRIPAVSRIENLPQSLAARCRGLGYTVIPKGGDYLYRTADLVGLKGDRYKSQRASYNHCVKQAVPSVRPYEQKDFDACVAVFRSWQESMPSQATELARHMSLDAACAHHIALQHADELGLLGLVAHVEGRLVGYTFGYPLTISAFCILLEITDRQIPGLSSYIFREFCRRLSGYELINAMDDCGLSGLRQAKERYHPVQMASSFIASQPPESL